MWAGLPPVERPLPAGLVGLAWSRSVWSRLVWARLRSAWAWLLALVGLAVPAGFQLLPAQVGLVPIPRELAGLDHQPVLADGARALIFLDDSALGVWPVPNLAVESSQSYSSR